MNNLLSYCGLVDATISASEKDLPVKVMTFKVPALPGFVLHVSMFRIEHYIAKCVQNHFDPTFEFKAILFETETRVIVNGKIVNNLGKK